MAENKACKECNQQFVLENEDLELLKKLSPTIAGRRLDLAVPQLCPKCRWQNRISWRNERMLYKRNCHLCGREMVSTYSPDKVNKACCSSCFWSDKWDPVDVGRDFDENKSFFEQFEQLTKESKVLTLFGTRNENGDYVNQETDDKSCYMTAGGHYNEEVFYSTFSVHGYRNIDCYWVWQCQNLYESIDCTNCNNSQYLTICENCNDCYFCHDCIECNDCFGCANLRHKRFCFFNEQLSESDYKNKIAEYLNSFEDIQRAKKETAKHILKYPKKFVRNTNCENSVGDFLANSKNAYDCYRGEKAEDSRHNYVIYDIKDSMDTSSFGPESELDYNVASSAMINRCIGCSHCTDSDSLFYCFNCVNSRDLMGCVGLNHKQYCILNKQYTKEEYEKLLSKIIDPMISDGSWGTYLPMKSSPFCYNESVAMEYFPLTKSEVDGKGLKWQDNDYGLKYDGPFYEPKDIKNYDPKQNPDAQKEIDACLAGILKCEITGKPFKILPLELSLYIERGIQIPRQQHNQRHLERIKKLNPMKLWHRQCTCEESGHDHSARCPNEFETTYAPDRPEKVYCESCYQKSVI